MFIELTLQIIIPVLILITFWAMPALMPADLAFGVRIPPNHQQDALISQVRRDFRIGIALIAIVLVLGSPFLTQALPFFWISIGPVFAAIILASLDYYIAHYRLRIVKKREDWFAGQRQAIAVDTEMHQEPIHLPILWLILTIALVVAMFAIGALRYPSLPDRIATHFDVNGVPNGWTDKGPGVFLTPLIALGETILLIALALFLPGKQAPLDPANIEASRTRHRKLRRVWGLSFMLISVLVNLLLLIISLVIWQSLPLTMLTFVVPAFPILIIIALLVIFYRLRGDQTQQNNAQTPYVARDDDRYWKMGTIYFNRDDPSIFVEKRFGIGWTVNFGHPVGILFMVVVLLIVAGSLLLAFFVK